jgi:hypothetical protein
MFVMSEEGTVSSDRAGPGSVSLDDRASRDPIDRERLQGLVEEGLTIARIAAALDRSVGSIRHWMSRYGLRTVRAGRPREEGREARATGRSVVEMRCPTHGQTEFVLEGRGYFRCRKCRAERVTRRRRAIKATLVREAGGRCRICGYDRCSGALEFHHVDPSLKEFNLGLRGVARSLDRARAEAAKCVLLCSNCHAEVEYGATALPATVLVATVDRSADAHFTPG